MSQTPEIYEVFVEENNHYADRSERYKIGDFASFDEALRVCKKIVEDFLTSNHQKKMTAENLYRIYTMFGEDAFIVGGSGNEKFSARRYAEERCRQICENEKAGEI